MRKLHGIAAILVAGALWGASTSFAESPQPATSPEVPRPILDPMPTAQSPSVPGPNAIMLTPVDMNGNPIGPGRTPIVPSGKPAQQSVTSSQAPASDNAAASANAAANALSNQLKPAKKVIGIIGNPATPSAQPEDITLDAEKQLRAGEDQLNFGSPGPNLPMSTTLPASTVSTGLPGDQTAANVPLDAYQVDSTTGAQTPVKRVQIPVEPLAAAPTAQSSQFDLPLNKTRPIELDRAVRDVIIGNPAVADVVVRAPGQVYLIGRAVGDTNVFLVDAKGNLVRRLDVVVHPDGASVEAALRQFLPKERIDAKGVGDSIVLSGTASSDGAAAQAQQIARRFVPADTNIVNMITIGSEQQVLIKVKVAEIEKSVLKQMSSTFDLATQDLGPVALDFASLATGLSSAIGTLGLASDDVDTEFQLLETHGLLRTLAEPNLLAISGEPASMLAGGEYPVVAVSSDATNPTVSVQYKPFGVSLAFLPVVIAPGRIWLKVSTEVSALSQTNSVQVPFGEDTFTILGLATRRANSTIELPSGGGIMIAGLLQNDIQSTVNGVPGLMDLPILGSLFRSTSFQRNETELVILVNVVLAKPVDPDMLATPTDGFAPSHDLDRYFLGNLQSKYVKRPPEGSQPTEGPKGPIGYIIN
ncbi:MAG TPA: type II and III secretion system protein family protein [Dongiaceae bacterium]|nr:type II and III secretion system protein family protein [Dongiaceae bacterium]